MAYIKYKTIMLNRTLGEFEPKAECNCGCAEKGLHASNCPIKNNII